MPSRIWSCVGQEQGIGLCSLDPRELGSVPAQSGSQRLPNTLTHEPGRESPESDAFCPANEVTWEDGGS